MARPSPPASPVPGRRHLVSDNAAGASPEVLEALVRANEGHALAYGRDGLTARAECTLRRHFGEEADVLFVFGGTGGNVVAIASGCEAHEAVLCADSSHLWRDECAAPERFLGSKLVPVASTGGKLAPDDLRPHLSDRGVVHRAQPRVLSIAQPTEWGTLYSVEELRVLGRFARDEGLLLHLDGARLSNAAAALDASLSELTTDVGVDVVTLGGTKNGLLFGEAVVLLRRGLTERARYVQKQAMQLPSKMRFVAAQVDALFEGDLWLRNARRANTMAARLGAGLERRPVARVVQPVQANSVFCTLPPQAVEPLRRSAWFEIWEPAGSLARLVTSFDTTEADVDRFLADLDALIS